MSDSQTVNALRKDGKLDEALNLAREIMSQDESDIWNIRAYGWALHDSIKSALNTDQSIAKKLIEEFGKMSIPEDEDILLKRREYFSNLDDPLFKLLQQAKEKSKSADYSGALKLYREAVSKSPDSTDANTGLAWELWRVSMNAGKDGQMHEVVEALREYSSLKSIEKPGEIHSRILSSATWCANSLPQYIEFVKWWDLSLLRSKDFSKQYSQKDGKTYDSLAEKVIKALHKAGKKHAETSDFEWISKFMGDNYEKYPEQEWFPYYYGKALAKTDDKEKARDILLPIVRAKKSEFWVWDVLASTYEEPETRITCLCAALDCKVKEDSFRVNVHAELGAALREQNILDRAKCEYVNSIDIYKNEEWKIPEELENIQNEQWFEETESAESNYDYYQEHAPKAHAILLASLPWEDALVSGHLPAREGKGELVFIGTVSGQLVNEFPAKPSSFPELKELPPGSPIRIKTEHFGDKTILVALESREGEKWDLVPLFAGVVSHINTDKAVAKVTTSTRDFCLLYFDKFPEARNLNLGSFVGVKMRTDTKRNISHALSFQEVDDLPDGCDFFASFDGFIDIGEGNAFGFVDDSYVSPHLIKQMHLEDGDHIIGKTVCEWNSNKGKSTWTVFSIDQVDHAQSF